MRRMKIPLQDFVLEMQGGGAVLCGLHAARAVSFQVYVYLPSPRTEFDLPVPI